MCHAARGRRKYLSAKSLLHFRADTSPLRHLSSTVRGVTATPPSGAPSAPAGVRSVVLRSGVYADSVKLMQVSRDIGARDGVTAVLVAMATPLNLELADRTWAWLPTSDASPEQLLIAIRADDDEALAAAEAAVDAALRRPRALRPAPPPPSRSARSAPASTTCRPDTPALAIISVPGRVRRRRGRRRDRRRPQRARLLRRRPGRARGRAQARRPRRRRAASWAPTAARRSSPASPSASPTSSAPGRSASSPRRGTGAQQVSCLLDMAGVGVSHVLGVGGRDLSEAVGGLATLDALARSGRRPGHRAGRCSSPSRRRPSVAGRSWRRPRPSCRCRCAPPSSRPRRPT